VFIEEDHLQRAVPLRSSEKELSEARVFFRIFAKPQLYEGRPEGELCATVVQPQRVVQKASAAILLYNGLALGEEADFGALNCLPALNLIRGRMFN
jgi:hypothetical protein